ncbi:MAG: hypothetical protein GXP40_00420, partial [Chloroflexi bacterium]|nr:hypothetical protein [Chloroflexota bacterium]
MKLLERIRQSFTPLKPLPEGVYHFQSPAEDELPYRLHLRLRPDGTSILIVNAATVLHLNPSATEYAYHLIKGATEEEAAKAVAKRYRVSRKQALQDYRDFAERIQTLVHTPDLDPVSYLDFERVAPHSGELSAPLRLDCALTYRLPRGAKAEDAPSKRVDRELTTEEWQLILEKAWAAGIPHVTFTGGEPTLRDDLPDLIAFAEAQGMVSGLLSDGAKLADKAYLDTLLQTGLDHLLFILQPGEKASWKALETILPEDLFTTVHLTITEANAGEVNAALERLAEMGANALSLTAAPGLDETQQAAREHASSLGLSLTWNLPVPYSTSHPVALETAEDNVPSGAGKAWLYVEPDGDVLPAQGMADTILGNFLRDDWATIWQNAT